MTERSAPAASAAAPSGPSPLSDAELVVLEQARSVHARREPSETRDAFTRLALLPGLPSQPGYPDEVTDAERAAAQADIGGVRAGEMADAGADEHGTSSLTDVLNRRRSVTTSLGPVARSDLVAMLARSYRLVEAGVDEDGRGWSRRPVPSGGATHPFELLITASNAPGLKPGHYVFGTSTISLRRLDPAHSAYAADIDAAVLTASRRSVPAPVTVSLVAVVERIAQHYVSLLAHLFRDAGVLLQTMHLLATDLGLQSSIIGSAGQLGPGRDAGGPTLVHCGALVLGSQDGPDDRRSGG